MRKFFCNISILGAFILFNINSAFANIVALVNDRPITQYQLDQRVGLITGTQNIEFKDQQEKNEFDQQILDRLIDEELVLGISEEFGWEVTEEMIDSAISVVEKRNELQTGQMATILQARDLSIDSYRTQMKFEILKGKIFGMFTNEVQVSESEARSYINRTQNLSSELELWLFSANSDKGNKSLSNLAKLRHSFIKRGCGKFSGDNLPNNIEQKIIYDYSELDNISKSIARDTPLKEVSRVYQENGVFKFIYIAQRSLKSSESIDEAKAELREQKALKKYELFLTNMRSKAEIIKKK